LIEHRHIFSDARVYRTLLAAMAYNPYGGWSSLAHACLSAMTASLKSCLSLVALTHCSSPSLWSAAGLSILPGLVACSRNGTAPWLRYATTHHTPRPRLLTRLSRSSTRHVLCPWDGTTSWCPAVQ
jgi:hypothetical protein